MLSWHEANSGLIHFTAALIHLRQQIPALTANSWWEEGDGNVRWLNKDAQPLSAQAFIRQQDLQAWYAVLPLLRA